jgi:hypothetical protein
MGVGGQQSAFGHFKPDQKHLLSIHQGFHLDALHGYGIPVFIMHCKHLSSSLFFHNLFKSLPGLLLQPKDVILTLLTEIAI